MKSQPTVIAVLTTFHPSKNLLYKITELSTQCSNVVVVDDTGPTPTEDHFYGSNIHFFENNKNVIYLKNDKNLGIAFSLNRGIRRAIELHSDFIVTFDDDTDFCPDYVERCLAFYASNTQLSIGAISMSRGAGFSKGSAEFKEKRSLITSGFFCRTNIYETVCIYPENYFIDLVDFYLSLKIRSEGFQLLELADVGMIHKVGDMVSRDLLIRVNIFNHSPFRLYYQVRNTVPFFSEFWRVDFAFCAYILIDIVRIPVKALLFEDRKMERIRYCFKGLFDGVVGCMGRIK